MIQSYITRVNTCDNCDYTWESSADTPAPKTCSACGHGCSEPKPDTDVKSDSDRPRWSPEDAG